MTRSSNKISRARRWTPLSLLCAPASLLLSLHPQSAVAGPTGQLATGPGLFAQLLADHNRVDGLAVEELDDGTTILRLKGTNKPTFNIYRLDDPDRLVVDIAKSAKGKVVPHVPLDTWACGRVTVQGVEERGAKLVRMVVELKRESSYIVVPDGDSLVVTVTPRDAPPEQYFARKSAATRKAELERRSARAAKMEADASALKAKASREAKAAEQRAAVAEKKVHAAESAATRARKAEARAKSAEQQAQRSLRDAKSNRLQIRRALKKATAEREKAENQRKAAEAKLVAAESAAESKRKEAQRLLGDAEAVARKRLADAAAKHARADRVLSEAERKAERKLADAEGSREEARAELAAAKKAAAAADARSERMLKAAQSKAAQAKAEAQRAKSAAASADAAAKKKLAAAESQAKARLSEAQAELRSAKAKAQKTETSARARLSEAQRTLASATASAKEAQAEADRVLAAAKRKAKETEAAAARRLADANSRAKQTEDEAARKLALADSRAKKTEDEAARKLALADSRAKQTEDEAARKLALADSRAKQTKAEADRALAAAASTAKKTQAQADRALAAANSKAARALADANSKAKRTEADAQKQAEEILAQARRKAAAEAARELADAKKAAATVVASAKREAASMKKKRLAEAESDASAKVARAEAQARTAAKKRLAAAEDEAERKLAAARKKARKDSIATAEKELARVRAQGGKQVAAAVASARGKAKTEADAELKKARAQIERDAATQIKLARAQASKAEADARAKLREADAKLATASATLAEAKADRASAEKLHATAQKKLASAEAARKRAEGEKSKAEAARKQAEATLAKIQREADNSKGRARRKADARLTKAEQEREAAVKRQLAASKKLASVEQATKKARTELAKARAEKKEARAQLAALQAERDDLRGQVEARDAKLEQMRKQLEEAPKVAAAAPQPQAKKRSKRSKKGRAKLQDVRFEQDEIETRVIVEFDGPARFDGMSLTPTIQLLKFSGAKLGKKLERSLDASSGQGSSVRVVTSFAEGPDAKVIVSTRTPVKPRLEEQAGKLVWHFPNVIADAPAAATKKVAQRQAKPAPRPKAVSRESGKVGGFASVPRPNAAMAPAAPAAQADVTRGRRSNRGRWRGERIDIELQDAPIKDVLLLFSDIGRVNIIAGDGVEGSVTMKLKSVPWDQALDIILRSLSLGSVREGNVIRIATLETLQQEQRDAIERANARVQLKPLETDLVALSYATVDEMIPKVQTVLSPRGTVTPDTRTNTLIIMDVAANIAIARDLVQSLDTQTPQVLIEARIVEARTTFTRQLGIQWGFDFTASPGTGNPTGLLFPNSIGLGGGGTGTPVDSRGLVLPGAAASPNYAVDLPAPVGTGAGGAVGMSFGSIGGNLNTNLRLSAAESTGEVRIISAPKVVTLDNSQATIEQGVQIPISQVSAQGVNTRFVNATLSLQVTPHVTNEGAVLLDVQVQKNEADFVNTGARGDPTILTRSANSRMLVNDADTAVIGGIYTRNKAVNYTKIPWLADIPIVGWFFKNKAEADTRSEVLIFLTPKIVNRASSIGG